MADFERVADVKDIPMGESLVIEQGGISVAIFNISGNFHAMNGLCPHQGGPLGEGLVDGHIVTCPWHGWQFDITTGESPLSSTVTQPCYELKVEGDDILLKLPEA